MKLYFSFSVAAMLTIGFSSTADAQSERAPSPIELMCDGLYTMIGSQALNVSIKGVLVVVGSRDAQIYDLPASFGNYRTGMKMNISERNPARIFLESAEGRAVTASINRLNGEISVSRHTSPGGKMLEYFSGNCRNKRQMF
jgi:hypothetical protein